MKPDMRYKDGEPSTPRSLAWQLAGYITDPSTIRAACINSFSGKPPQIDAIKQMIVDRQPRVKWHYSKISDKGLNYNPDTDTGEPWRPRGLVNDDLPKRLNKPAMPHVRPKYIKPVQVSPGVQTGPIIDAVAAAFKLSTADMLGKGRQRHLLCARCVAVKLIRDIVDGYGQPRFSYPWIGRIMGGRDHSTIINAAGQYDNYAKQHPHVAEIYEALRK
tara:strand:+ start:16899 stop:17549 length:651 start_codon:yes stop_codon:yes gene_type:complete